MAAPIAVIDFETTGMAPAQGARATEVAIVLMEGEQVVDRFDSLMRTGVPIPPFIEQLTGISNAMLATAPPAEAVMREAARFVGSAPMVAHNAAFDSKFWQSELQHAGLAAPQPFACTVLLSRRVFPDAPSHSLGRITDHLGLPRTGRAHRALADAMTTAHLLIRMQREIADRYASALDGRAVSHALLRHLQRAPKDQLARHLAQYRPGR